MEPILDPPLYDPRMVYTLTGTCRCCGVVDAEAQPGIHQKGCPVPILESLCYRLEVDVDRHGPSISGDGTTLLQAAENLYSQFEDVCYEYHADESGTADGEPDIYCPVRVSITAEVQVPKRRIHACMVQVEEQSRVNHKAMQDAYATMGLTAERRDELEQVEKRREIYTDAGYAKVRSDILNDPKYANLPPYEAE